MALDGLLLKPKLFTQAISSQKVDGLFHRLKISSLEDSQPGALDV